MLVCVTSFNAFFLRAELLLSKDRSGRSVFQDFLDFSTHEAKALYARCLASVPMPVYSGRGSCGGTEAGAEAETEAGAARHRESDRQCLRLPAPAPFELIADYISVLLDSLHAPSMVTEMFQTYEGEICLVGPRKLLWHRLAINPQKMQVLSKSQRKFPFSPTNTSTPTPTPASTPTKPELKEMIENTSKYVYICVHVLHMCTCSH